MRIFPFFKSPTSGQELSFCACEKHLIAEPFSSSTNIQVPIHCLSHRINAITLQIFVVTLFGDNNVQLLLTTVPSHHGPTITHSHFVVGGVVLLIVVFFICSVVVSRPVSLAPLTTHCPTPILCCAYAPLVHIPTNHPTNPNNQPTNLTKPNK